MIRWTGLAPWGFEFSFPDILTTTFLAADIWLANLHRSVTLFLVSNEIFARFGRANNSRAFVK